MGVKKEVRRNALHMFLMQKVASSYPIGERTSLEKRLTTGKIMLLLGIESQLCKAYSSTREILSKEVNSSFMWEVELFSSEGGKEEYVFSFLITIQRHAMPSP